MHLVCPIQPNELWSPDSKHISKEHMGKPLMGCIGSGCRPTSHRQGDQELPEDQRPVMIQLSKEDLDVAQPFLPCPQSPPLLSLPWHGLLTLNWLLKEISILLLDKLGLSRLLPGHLWALSSSSCQRSSLKALNLISFFLEVVNASEAECDGERV